MESFVVRFLPKFAFYRVTHSKEGYAHIQLLTNNSLIVSPFNKHGKTLVYMIEM